MSKKNVHCKAEMIKARDFLSFGKNRTVSGTM